MATMKIQMCTTFLAAFQEHPELYDLNSPHYYNKHARRRALEGICEEIGIPKNDVTIKAVTNKIKQLRSTFAKCLRESRSGPETEDGPAVTWKWFQYLTFLTPHMKLRKGVNNSETIEDDGPDDVTDGSIVVSLSQPFTPPTPCSEDLEEVEIVPSSPSSPPHPSAEHIIIVQRHDSSTPGLPPQDQAQAAMSQSRPQTNKGGNPILVEARSPPTSLMDTSTQTQREQQGSNYFFCQLLRARLDELPNRVTARLHVKILTLIEEAQEQCDL